MKKQVTSIVTQLGRLLVLFIFASFVMVTHVEGQTKEVKITLSCNNEPMPQVLKKVEKLSKFKVLFTYDEIANYKVSLDLKEASISKTLSEIIGSYPLKYSIRGSYITISQKSIAPNEKMISGSVKDIEGEPLPGARVSIKGASVNVASDVDGLFYIIIPASIPDAVLVFDFIGMKSREISVAGIDASLPLNVVMDYSKENLEEVVVTGIFERKKRVILVLQQ
jgi:Secretin and TonB N terminus short domain.